MKNYLYCAFFLLFSIGLKAQEKETEKSSHLVKGAYETFHEFVTNNPAIIDSFYVKSKERNHKSWVGTSNLIPKYAETNKKIKHIWGFCDGEQAYVMHQGEFFPISVIGDQYKFIGYDIIDNGGATAAAVLGGAIGGGIYSAAAISKAKKNKTLYTIDRETGLAIHPTRSTPSNVIDAEVVFYRRAKNELIEPIVFMVDDSLTYSFIPGSLVRIGFKENRTIMKVCYGPNFSECIEIIRDHMYDNYVECMLLEDEINATVQEVDTSKGEFDSFKARKIQKKREKALRKNE